MIKRRNTRPKPVVVPVEVWDDPHLSLVDLGLYVTAVAHLEGQDPEYTFEDLVPHICHTVIDDPDMTYPEVRDKLVRLAGHLGFDDDPEPERPELPKWCGQCDNPATRWDTKIDASCRSVLVPCPKCHPDPEGVYRRSREQRARLDALL